MRQSIGEISTLNIIIIFIVIVFGLLSATLNYYKAFKLNTRILDVVEKYEGYNDLSREAITNDLNSFGYTQNSNWACPSKSGSLNLVGTGSSNAEKNANHTMGNNSNVPSHYYCLYYVQNDGSTHRDSSKDSLKTNLDNRPLFYNYVVVTYIFVDLPIVGQFKIPVRTKGQRIYSFSYKNGNPILK